MTEKLFNVNLDFVYDKEGNLYSLQDCCDLLNELNDKNEQLKADKQALIDFIRKKFPKSHKHILERIEYENIWE